MKLSVGLKVANSLSLTPQLQQAIRLLQLSNLELEQEIQLQLESNPLLEQIDDENSISTLSNSNNTDIHELDQSLNADHLPEELPVDTHWDEIYIHQSTALETPEFQEQEDNNHKSLNLKQHLFEQINLLHFSQIDQLIAYCLVDSLDQRGFLEAEIEEITASVQNLLAEMGHEEEVEDDEVYVVLKHIQQLDPLGAGSRNLAECLRIQLEALPSVPVIQDALILLEHYHLLIANDLGKLLKQTGLNTERLKSAINMLKTLKAYPGIEFEDESSNYQIPDVIVSKKDQIWHVQLNTDILPKLRINSFYAGMIRRADQSTDNNYLKDQLYEAKNFIKSIDERHKTLLKVASCIVEHQRTFFEIGAEGMKPLILREVAEEVQLHESTVSRVTSNKYMLTPRGLFELKYFFSSHVGTTSGGEASSTAIRAMIKKLVSNENPRKPLSDNSITNLLKEEGIDVARRTVAKYRESLNIPSSSDRKVLI
ncbi:RNA polymerase factor sigma-54 [Acinetobacter radioresistens]|uniref:RNA polymerase factor sigma-54 n=1 Tax=Acinetobacter radioresistens TaxID=40216 RepID=UPI00202E8A91|nr:RNA polymerase factor sigma-54 [Acinetobacter radioresistens]MCM1936392.1 RNA polymerase factor sigma-54 [Acinetobacter radioresistens]MCM1954044.1 RNA polymerase factor sigma-54 [Acinetobacter radioresistens]MCU4309642.1 RNA polymerase factor sigma-54 [Acinetobacter radioresistens]MCU4567766.1 RNA polymerase factor sigma-54 [Acinetobacter radioresistens]